MVLCCAYFAHNTITRVHEDSKTCYEQIPMPKRTHHDLESKKEPTKKRGCNSDNSAIATMAHQYYEDAGTIALILGLTYKEKTWSPITPLSTVVFNTTPDIKWTKHECRVISAVLGTSLIGSHDVFDEYVDDLGMLITFVLATYYESKKQKIKISCASLKEGVTPALCTSPWALGHRVVL
jgi:hypothetical protein